MAHRLSTFGSRRSVCRPYFAALACIGSYVGGWTPTNAAAQAIADTASEAITIDSPDGRLDCVVTTPQGALTISLIRDGVAVLEESAIAVLVDGKSLTDSITLGAVERGSIDETYVWRGSHSQAVNRCNTATLAISPSNGGAPLRLEVRVFDDGLAFRHVIAAPPGGSAERVPDEATTFAIPAGSTVWFHDLEGHYESPHRQSVVAKVEAGTWAAPPMTFQLPGGAGYAAITEAALVNYSGMALRAAGENKFTIALGHAHPPSYPFRLRYEDDVESMKLPAKVAGEIVSPWRVVLAASDLNGLVNSDVVHNVCPPPDAELFPQGMNEPWIKPGRAVWKYLDGGDNSLEEVLNFNRLAGELGFEYQVVEGFWSRWSDAEVRRAVADARDHGVGLWFWRHSNELRTAEARRAFFQQLEDWGVVGAKIDFFDHEHREVVDLYKALLEEAARHHIMVNFHGANKPTGEARTWPNELTREGVKGMEARRLADRARHDATLPFTRYLAGPGDYTPVVFGERRGDTTAAHQIATAVAFDEPLLTFGAHPQALLNHPAVGMIKSIPAVWDETIVLPASTIGEVAAFARRRGEEWFIAIVNGPQACELSVKPSFLQDGAYDAHYVRDSGGDPTQVRLEQTTARRDDKLAIDLDAGGGFVGRFSPARPVDSTATATAPAP